MNKNDWYLVITITVFCVIGLFCFQILSKTDIKTANVYYENKKIKTIDLTIDSTYEVQGKNGTVVLEVKEGAIRVKSENSPLHLCSRQGYIKKNTEVIVCLPNKIVVQIEEETDIDTIVR